MWLKIQSKNYLKKYVRHPLLLQYFIIKKIKFSLFIKLMFNHCMIFDQRVVLTLFAYKKCTIFSLVSLFECRKKREKLNRKIIKKKSGKETRKLNSRTPHRAVSQTKKQKNAKCRTRFINLLSRLINMMHGFLLHILWNFRSVCRLYSFSWIVVNTLNSHSTYSCRTWCYVWWYLRKLISVQCLFNSFNRQRKTYS